MQRVGKNGLFAQPSEISKRPKIAWNSNPPRRGSRYRYRTNGSDVPMRQTPVRGDPAALTSDVSARGCFGPIVNPSDGHKASTGRVTAN